MRSPHYKGGRGCQPTAVVWAEQDLVLADQYRDGNVPASQTRPAVHRAAQESRGREQSGAAGAPAALVRWHWEKAGTIEFGHHVSKNDLAAGMPPSGKFGANAAWYRLTLLTYNVLTLLGHRALPERFRRARPCATHDG
jgi:hypothetical protein